MTVQEIKDMLVAVDPEVQRYDHDRAGTGDAYTVWQETTPDGFYGDGQEEGSLRFQVDRFTKEEDDEIAQRLKEALEARDDVAMDYLVDVEKDTGCVHHIYACVGA